MIPAAAVTVAVELIKQFEGCRLAPYLDTVGVPTIGYGDTILADGLRVTMQTPPISQADANDLLSKRLAVDVVVPLGRCVTVPLNSNQWGALMSLCWNVGVPRIAASNLMAAINAGNLDSAGQDFLAWDHAGGRVLDPLLERRRAELAVWDTAVSA